MKKIFTLCAILLSAVAVNAQNLLQNPGLETWDAGKALPWDFYAGNNAKVVYSQETAIVKEGTSAVKITNPADAATANVSQALVGDFTVGDTYTVSFDYYTVSGDESDVRIWSAWKSGTLTASTQIAHDLDVLQLGGGSTTLYLPSNMGTWSNYTITTTVPVGATIFDFRVRSYKGSVAIFDNLSFTKVNGSGIGSETATSKSNVYAEAGVIKVDLTDDSIKTIEVYGALGELVVKADANLGLNTIPVEAGQLMIVKVGTEVSKVLTK